MLKKILLLIMTITAAMTVTNLEAVTDDNTYTWNGVEYNTIFRDENGVFHGIIEVHKWESLDIDTAPVSTTLFDLTRDTDDLTNIHIKYESDNRRFFNIFGEKEIYEMTVDYSNMNKFFNLGTFVEDLQKYDAAMWKMNPADPFTVGGFFNKKEYIADYVLITNKNAPVSTILEFEFDFVLPDYETAAVQEEMIEAEALEISEVLNDPTLTEEEKYIAVEEIKDAYEDAFLDYGELLTYVGNAEDLAIAKGEILYNNVATINELLNSFTSALDQFVHYLVKMVALVFVGIFGVLAMILSFTFLKPVMSGLGKFVGRISGLLLIVGILEYFGVGNISIYHDLAAYVVMVKDSTLLLVSDLSTASSQLSGFTFADFLGGLFK